MIKKGQRVFYKQLLKVVLIFAIAPSILMFSISTTVYMNHIIDRYANRERDILDKIQLANNEIFTEMIATFHDLTFSDELEYFTKHSFETDIVRFNRFMKQINSKIALTEFVNTISLYIHNEAYFITLGTTKLINRNLDRWLELNDEKWFNKLFLSKDLYSDENAVFYIHPSYINGIKGDALFLIKMDIATISAQMDKMNIDGERSIYLVLDEIPIHISGREFSEINTIQRLLKDKEWTSLRQNGIKYIVSRTDQNENYYYVSIIENNVYLNEINNFIAVALINLLLTLFLSSILAIRYSRKLYKPVKILLNRLSSVKEREDRIDEFQLILTRYAGVLEKSNKLKKIVSSNELILRDRFVENFLKNHFELSSSLEQGFERFNIPRKKTACVLNIYIENREILATENWIYWNQIKNTVMKCAETGILESSLVEGFTCELSGEELLILLFISGNDEEKINTYINNLMDKTERMIDCQIHLGLGGTKMHVHELPISYLESKKALNMGFIPTKTRIHRTTTALGQQLQYKAENIYLNKFIKLIHDPNDYSIEQYIDEILQDTSYTTDVNILKNMYIRLINQIFYYLIDHTGSKLNDYITVNPYIRIVSCKTEGEVRMLLMSFITEAIQLLKNRTHYLSSTNFKVTQAIDYIESNYTDISLSLSAVASKIRINSSYLSRVFKQEIGRTFQDYLTSFRIKKAKQLMLEQYDYHMYIISKKTGFGSPISFTRAFKKYEGCTPREFQENHKQIKQ